MMEKTTTSEGTAPSQAMVLRSVHLPVEMDEKLRILAFHQRVSKADLIRNFVNMGLNTVVRELSDESYDTEKRQLLERILSVGSGNY